MKKVLILLLWALNQAWGLNLAPNFIDNMNQHTIKENTPVGSIIYTLKGSDPEGSRVRFGLSGTDLLEVDELTGSVKISREIDREKVDFNEVRLVVTIQDEPQEPGQIPNVVRVPISVIILDENDNQPEFRGLPYKASIREDIPVESTLFQAIEVTDQDLVGDVLDVQCAHRPGFEPGVCDSFAIEPRRLETDHDMFRGSVVLKKPLDYKIKQIYRLPIVVKDGRFEVESEIVFNVLDVQNTPPQFMGSLTGIVSEDDPVGTKVLTVKARDGDTGQARRIIFTLEENPNGYFAIDQVSGDITIDKPIDRETLGPSSGGVLMLRVRASELVNGVPRESDPSTTSTADITITIRDVNDEPPQFNQNEYKVSLHENVPEGTPLANLNMEVKDLDTAPNAIFQVSLVGGDPNGKFSVEPEKATGTSQISLKVNSDNLDYENANERKFLLLVEAKEPSGQLSSTATVTVEVLDLNDNSPTFPKDSYTALVSETAPEGQEVITIVAEDRDSENFGTFGIRYKLMGQGSELFNVDPVNGKITVASCVQDCLDYEKNRAYYLSYSATDDLGKGKKTVVNLRISIADANDNAPKFAQRVYKASIDEGEQKFEPALILKASDLDESSILRFNIVEGNTNNLFNLNRLTGEVSVRQRSGLRLDNIPTDMIVLSVQVSDGDFNDNARVEIHVKDVNDRLPVFEKSVYLSSVPESAPIGTPIENVQATDADFGPNAEIEYKISKGAYDDFAIDGDSGQISLNRNLDYDRRDSYSIEVIAVDKGVPALTGTATLTVSVMNKNNKEPYFLPSTQRAQVTENAPIGELVIQMNGTDPDVTGQDNLVFNFVEPIEAVDKDGAKVNDNDGRFKNYFKINETNGEVFVNDELDRSIAAIITLTVSLTDLSADPVQVGLGSLVITIVDVNDFPPAFLEPWTPQRPFLNINVPEEQPKGTIVHTFRAVDADSNIDRFKIISPSRSKRPYEIDSETGDLIITDRIDYEALDTKELTFDLAVYDAGVPQKSAMATVVVNVENLNDEAPVFQNPQGYSASVMENSPIGTEILRVQATDKDEGEFGQVEFQVSHPAFDIDPKAGLLTVANPQLLDRETNPEITVQVLAKDVAPNSRTTSVPINITVLDANDNPPRFIKKVYTATIVDNIPYYPDPSPIIQLLAEDADIGINGQLFFYIISGNDLGQFFIDPSKGIIYPNTSFVGQQGATFELTVQVYDENGAVQAWEQPDQAIIAISVENVNTHKPEWFPDPPPNETIELMEEEDISNYVILKVNARDRDRDSDNGRVSYHFKINNDNVGETQEFKIDPETGEVRAKTMFDRETQDTYELVLVAKDHGTPVSFETLRFVTIKIKDINDHDPKFDVKNWDEDIRFTVPEEEESGYFVGKVEANDPDEGKNGRVFYYIIDGNDEKWFSIDKTYGNIYTKQKLDREERDHYMIQVKTTNDPDLVCEGSVCDIEPVQDPRQDDSVIMVHIFVEDKNDNLPQFEAEEFFIGIPFDAKIGDLILDAQAYDPDVPDETSDESYANKISYSIRTSNLYRSGSTQSSGSLVPSPFEIQQNGRLVLASLVAEFTQDKFVIEIEAKESLNSHRTRATVHLWIYEPSQLIKLIVNMPPMQVNKEKMSIVKALKNVTQEVVVLDDIRYHISSTEGLRRDMTDMYIHVVNEIDNTIVEPDEVLNVVDDNYDTLAKVYIDAGIQKIVPAAASQESTTNFVENLDPNLAALIALLIALFIGAILFAILCCCIKNWALASAVAKTSKPQKLPPASPGLSRPMSAMAGGGIYNNPTSLIDTPDGGPVSGTENPLWIDQKYKAYEEQELTMTVFSDQDNSVISGQPGNGNGASRPASISRASAGFGGMETNSNAYATINKLPLVAGTASRRRSLLGLVEHGNLNGGERDYATLEKMSSPRSPPGPIVPGVHSSTPLGGIARRFSNDFAAGNGTGSRANLIINQNGEPELVADLM